MKKETEKLEALINIGTRLALSTDLDQLLNELNDCAKEICESEWASILLVDKETNELYFKTAAGGEANVVKKMRLSMGAGIAGWVAQQNESLIVNDVSSDPRFLGNIDDKFTLQTRNILAVPINFNGTTIGVIEVGNKKNNELYTEREKYYLEVISSQSGIALNNACLIRALNNFKTYALDLIVTATDSTNNGHSIEVARVATSVAREMGLPDNDYQDIYYASLLHDIGFINKNLPDIQTKHPQTGASMIEHIEVLKNVAPIIASHHEKFDGSGYPNGLKGRDIPALARIVGFAEAYVEYARGDSTVNPFKNSQQFDGNVMLAARKLLGNNDLL